MRLVVSFALLGRGKSVAVERYSSEFTSKYTCYTCPITSLLPLLPGKDGPLGRQSWGDALLPWDDEGGVVEIKLSGWTYFVFSTRLQNIVPFLLFLFRNFFFSKHFFIAHIVCVIQLSGILIVHLLSLETFSASISDRYRSNLWPDEDKHGETLQSGWVCWSNQEVFIGSIGGC
jgi:hypothetical protein